MEFRLLHLPGGVDAGAAAAVICSELSAMDDATEVAYSGAIRYAPRLQRDDISTAAAARPLLDESSTVLVTGGARGITAEAAIALARQAAEHGWSVREVEHRVQQLSAGQVPTSSAAKPKAAKAKPQADIVALERELSESLSTKVNVLHGRGGKGRLVIHYADLDSLEGVLEKLRGTVAP